MGAAFLLSRKQPRGDAWKNREYRVEMKATPRSKDWNSSTDMSQQQAVRIEPFRGTINVMFSDAVIASSEHALVLTEDGGEPRYYIPFEDIYFEFLEQSGAAEGSEQLGRALCWRASAVGESAEVMRAFPEAAGPYEQLHNHGTFLPGKARIQTVPRPDPLTDVP